MKFIKMVLLSITCIALLSSCSSPKQKEINSESLVKDIYSSAEFADEMMAIEYPVLSDFYNIDNADLANYKVYISSSGATAEEVSVFEAKDELTADKIKTAVSERIEDLKFSFKDYKPEEMDKLNNSILIEKGKYVIFCSSNHPDNVKKTINGYIK